MPFARFIRASVVVVCGSSVLSCRQADAALQGIGTIEVTESEVAPMFAARVTKVWVEEGARVKVGDTLVSLTQVTIPADIEAKRANVAAAEAQLKEAQVGPRRGEIDRAAAEFRAAEADAERARRDVERLAPLAERQDISAQDFDAAKTAERLTANRRDAARETLRLLKEGTRPERVAAARANVATARAALSGAQATAGELALISATNGTVLSRHAEAGELLGAGQSALTLGELSRPWVRIYVNQNALPRIRIGDKAWAKLDAYPDHPIAGHVVSINEKAEFTPRVALTERERADLLFGVKVALDDTSGFLKPGLPVTVHIDGSGTPPAEKGTAKTPAGSAR